MIFITYKCHTKRTDTHTHIQQIEIKASMLIKNK